MNPQSESDSSGRFIITLEVVTEDPHDADPALVDAVGRNTTDALRSDGYTIEPVYTGQRGGFLIDVVIPFLTTIWVQKDVILADGSALVTIFTPVILVAKHLKEAHEKRVGKDANQQSPIKITTEIDGVPLSIEPPDLETAEAALKLAQRFQTAYPVVAAMVTPQSKVKVKGSVPKKPSRKRR
ncbi:MAG: hypothetical protein ACJ788_10200 [Ktedonobacteraceae bacterium]